MQVQQEMSEQSQEQRLQELQRQVDELQTENFLLRDQLARREQFTAMIAHDLRSPLSPIINYAQMITRHADTPADESKQAKRQGALQRHTSIIVSQAKRMSRMVNDLLDASRLSDGKFSLVCEECDLVTIAREMLEQLRPLAPYHELVLETTHKHVPGNWDCGRLQQALGNLLDNAIKYSDERTTITVSIGEHEQHIRVSVHNQGTSIPSNDIGLLFRPYTRLPATSQRQQGSGLGLYITKSIIEAHGGILRLEPSSEEEPRSTGTTFTFELPSVVPNQS